MQTPSMDSYKEIKADKNKKRVINKAAAYLKKIAQHIVENSTTSLEKDGLKLLSQTNLILIISVSKLKILTK